MLRLLVLSALLALTRAEGLESFKGEWTSVRAFFEEKRVISEDCTSSTVGIADRYCKCGFDDKVPVARFKFPGFQIEEPVIIVEDIQQVEDALKLKCSCPEPKPFWVFRRLSENYLTAYYSKVDRDYFVLVAREVPTVDELDSFVESVEELRGKTGANVCTSKIDKTGLKRKTGATTSGKATVWYKLRIN